MGGVGSNPTLINKVSNFGTKKDKDWFITMLVKKIDYVKLYYSWYFYNVFGFYW